MCKNIAANGSKWIRREKRLAIYKRDEWKCIYCGSTEDLTLDHIIPQSKGGDNSEKNLVTACRSCNSKRRNKNIKKFIADIYSSDICNSDICSDEKIEYKIKKIRNHIRRRIKKGYINERDQISTKG